jgi:hypothetical protein
MAVELNVVGNPLVVEVKDYQIDGETYRVHVGYSNRNGWYVSIYNTDDVAILLGITLISEPQNLTWRYSRGGGLFKGDLWVFNNTGDYTKALTKDNFGEGKMWGLYYLTTTEMTELGVSKR